MIRNFLYLIFFSLMIFSCTKNAENKTFEATQTELSGRLNDQDIDMFLKVYPELKKLGLNLQSIEGQDFFKKFESTAQKAGFRDYRHFMIVTGKIAFAFNLVQGQKGMDDFSKMKDDGMHTIDSILNDPNIPEETKKELRKGKQAIQENWDKNEPWAKMSLNIMGTVIEKMTHPEDIEMVKKRREEIEKVLRGF